MTIQLTVPKVACSSCVDTITKAVQQVDANAIVKADVKTKIINIETLASEAFVKQAIASVGYPSI
ncbi:MAG TPA: cation transporter [Nostocaceae cyanobacterium]|nr:cation transporter [Nostocaceae cyanobacterium]